MAAQTFEGCYLEAFALAVELANLNIETKIIDHAVCPHRRSA